MWSQKACLLALWLNKGAWFPPYIYINIYIYEGDTPQTTRKPVNALDEAECVYLPHKCWYTEHVRFISASLVPTRRVHSRSSIYEIKNHYFKSTVSLSEHLI